VLNKFNEFKKSEPLILFMSRGFEFLFSFRCDAPFRVLFANSASHRMAN